MQQIAIYGKGGIGKSTLSAHLSAALSVKGVKVIQIGCDPKHDSTRLLTRGRAIPTVLDYLRVTNPLDFQSSDVIFEGFNGIGCVEAGGPKPGVGCAGRGIISTFDLLEQFEIDKHYDLALYDVLGDVVCGGFAVPIRNEYADTIFIVTSGGFMSLYAANNILRGIQNYDQKEPRVAGILYNKGNLSDEDERVTRFAEAVGLPIVATFPRSEGFVAAEREGKTLIETGSNAEIIGLFNTLADSIIEGMQRYRAVPLEDEALEACVLEGRSAAAEAVSSPSTETAHDKADAGSHLAERLTDLANSNRYLSKNVIMREPLHGCAFNGALTMCLHLADAVVIAHAPKSCAFLSYQSFNSTGRRSLFERGALLPVSLSPNLECTEMNEADMVFGGMEALHRKLDEVKKQNPKAIVVISSCPAGIIGDDIEQVEKPADENGCAIVTLKTDGNMTGDYLQGMLMCYTILAKSFIRADAEPVPNTVNVVFEKVIARNTESNFLQIESFLNRMGISVNCRFLCDTTVEKLENFCSAPLNLLGSKDYTGRMLQDFFETEYGSRFLEYGFPVGYAETVRWLEAVGKFFDREDTARALIAENEARYNEEVARLKPQLEGSKLMIITYNHNLDWILKTALDLGIEVVKLGILNFSQDAGFTTEYPGTFNVEENYNTENRLADIEHYQPDILLSNYEFPGNQQVKVADTIPMCPDVGFFSGLNLAKRWAALRKMETRGEWMLDERLFKKYYTG